MEERIIEGYKVRSLKSIEKMKIVIASICQLFLGFSILTFSIKLTFGVGTTYVMLLLERHVTMGIALRLFEGTILMCVMIIVITALWRACAHFGRRLFLALRDKYVFVMDTDTEDKFIMLDEEFNDLVQHIQPLNNILNSLKTGEGQNEDS